MSVILGQEKDHFDTFRPGDTDSIRHMIKDAISRDISENLNGVVETYITKLPKEYQQLEYLESNGHQYVSSEYKGNQDTRVKIKFKIDEILSGTNTIFGSRYTSTVRALVIGMFNTGKYFVNYGSSASVYELGDFDGQEHIIDIDKNNFYFDGTLKDTATYENFNLNYNMGVFGARSQSNYYYGNVKIYYVEIYNNNELVRNLIPCKRLADSVQGLYDTVSGTFLVIADAQSTAPLISGKAFSFENVYENLNSLENEIEESNTRLNVPQYIIDEANRVAEKVRNEQTGTSITFIAVSDMHYNVDDETIQKALSDMANGIKELAKQIRIDFYTTFGDEIYRLRENGNFEKGKAEIISMTKLLNNCMTFDKQIRLVGNHDPNAEGSSGYFTANQLNSFIGLYSNVLIKNEEFPYGGIGFYDIERQKIRIIALNTSLYEQNSTPTQQQTQYSFGLRQAQWLCQMLDISAKQDANDWQIIVMSHINIDTTEHAAAIGKYSSVFAAYENGTTWTDGAYSYNFSGKNIAKLALYINGHWHQYRVKNVNHITSGGTLVSVLSMANLYVPNALPDRDYESMDGITYTKTTNTQSSTAFQVITLDPVSKTVYAIHYGAGIDIILHYESDLISAQKTLTTALTSPIWHTNDTNIATISNGVITPVSDGNTLIWCKSTADNCIEAWNIKVDV